MATPLTTHDAESHVASMNQRIRKAVPQFMASRFPPVYVYNIYNRQHEVMLGSLGKYVIPACEPGQPYSKPCIVQGFIADEYDLADGRGNMAWNAESGADVAKDVVGIGSYSAGLSALTTNREWWGVFIAADEVPTKAELAAARAKLDENMRFWLRDGDRLAPQQLDPKAERISLTHIEAAVYLHQPREWANPVRAMQECPGCGTPVKPNIAKCGSCGAILDRDKAIELGLIPDTAPATAPLSTIAKVVQK